MNGGQLLCLVRMGRAAVFEQHLLVAVRATLGRLPLGLGGSLRAALLPLPSGCLGSLHHHDLGLPFALLLNLGGDLRAIATLRSWRQGCCPGRMR